MLAHLKTKDAILTASVGEKESTEFGSVVGQGTIGAGLNLSN